MNKDTIAAIATSLSDSGIGIIRISGEDAISIGDSVFCTQSGKHILMDAPSHTIHYGYIVSFGTNTETDHWKDFIIDEVMVSVMRAPKSYTTEDTIEINCHGGVLVMQKVLENVLSAGARISEPGEFTKRAFLNGRIDLSRAEAVIDIIHSQNQLALKSSMEQLKGNLAKEIRELRQKILYETAFIESALDDPEHISLEGYPEKLSGNISEIKERIHQLLISADNGKIIKEGINTVIVGKPNAGKSSLLNYIVGEERAIVTDIAGTTRDILKESVRLGDISLNLIDTAGIRNTEDVVEKLGVEKAKHYVKDADLILFVADSSIPLDENDFDIIRLLYQKRCIVLLNKTDLNQVLNRDDFLNAVKDVFEKDGYPVDNISKQIRVLSVSAKNQVGIDSLQKTLEEMFFCGEISINNQLIITNMRHKEALQGAYDSICFVENSIRDGLPEDFYSIDLMSAYSYLGLIIGEEVGEDLVEEIFSKFCMGK